MARHGLRGGDLDLLRQLLSEHFLERLRLHHVVEVRGSAVRIDVIDRRKILHARILQRNADRLHRARAAWVGCRDVVGVGGRAVTGQFTVDLCAARLGMFLRLEDQHRRTLTHHETVAVDVERAGRLLGAIVELRRQRAHLHEPADGELKDRRLGAAGDNYVGTARTDGVERHAERIRRGGACRHHHLGGALRTQRHRDVARAFVGDQLGDRQGRETVRTAFEERLPRLAGCLHAANAVAEDRPHAIHIRLILIGETGIPPRFDRRRHRIDGEVVHVPRSLPVHIPRRVKIGLKILEFARHLTGAS